MLSHTQIKWVRNDKRQPVPGRRQHAMACPLGRRTGCGITEGVVVYVVLHSLRLSHRITPCQHGQGCTKRGHGSAARLTPRPCP